MVTKTVIQKDPPLVICGAHRRLTFSPPAAGRGAGGIRERDVDELRGALKEFLTARQVP
jgi:hypothetical protein